jgi:hypothetical protein
MFVIIVILICDIAGVALKNMARSELLTKYYPIDNPSSVQVMWRDW